MVQAKYAVLLVVVAAIAVTVPIAQGTTAAKDPRVTKLTKQVSALKTQVGSLKADVSSLESDVGSLKTQVASLTTDDTNVKATVTTLQNSVTCLQFKALPVTQYGTASGEGYVYATGGGATLLLDTALDITTSGQTPQFWLPELNPTCVKSFQHASSTRRLEAFRP